MAIQFSIPCFAALKPDASAREKILTAASELLLTEGFSTLTQQAVAKRAGVRQSHVTYYFATRNDLLRATAQFVVETLLEPTAIAGATVDGKASLDAFRNLSMPEKSDRQWFRLMTALQIAGDDDPLIRPWLRELDARIIDKIGTGFVAVGVPISLDQQHFLYATLLGVLCLDMRHQTDESFARVERAMEMAMDLVLPSSSSVRAKITTTATATATPTQTHNPHKRPLHKSHVKTV